MTKATKVDELGRPIMVTKKARVALEHTSGKFFPVDTYELTTLTPGPTAETFAEHAWKQCRNSLRRLMTPDYKLVVYYEDREERYSLTKWIKLIDPEVEKAKLKKAQERARKKAAA